MLKPEQTRMTAEAFMEWNVEQTERYELVNGYPVRMMTGAKREHRRVVSNLGLALEPQVRQRGCFTSTHDAAVRTAEGGVRYPDLVVECGIDSDDNLAPSEPKVVFEVLSPSTRSFDLLDKLSEYRAHPAIAMVVLIDPGRVDVRVYSREADDWSERALRRLDDRTDLVTVGAELSLGAIYDGLDPTPNLETVE